MSNRKIAPPLKVLIPLIQGELQMGNNAGREHYRRAGEMLIEAKDQVSHGQWGSWLRKNFDLHGDTARVYMRWARLHQNRNDVPTPGPTSLRQMTGATERDREQRQSKQRQQFRRVLRDMTRDEFIKSRLDPANLPVTV